MGDIADYHVEQMIDQGLWGFACRRGRDSYGPPLKCRYCNSEKVYWQAVKGKHELYDKETLKPHVCEITDTEGFEDVV